MKRSSKVIGALPILLLAVLPSCAWSNKDNRPVWNSFEKNLVPDGTGLFAATLPLTVPLGLASIVVDTFLAHPLQVVDDAYDDAANLWDEDDLEFDTAYYTEMGFLPVRTVFTPVVFAGSFLGRSVFDIRAPVAPMSDAEREAEEQRREKARIERQRKSFIAWLQSTRATGEAPDIGEWHESFEEPMREALAGDASRRVRLHGGMLGASHTRIGNYDGELGLKDADPVVRYTSVINWPRRSGRPSASVLRALLSDSVDSVRLAAERRFKR